MKTLVVYRSKTGFTKTYAEWIAHVLAADLREHGSVRPEQFVAYDTIIYGGGLYAGGINGVGLIKNNLGTLKDKRVIVFATGTSVVSEDTTIRIQKQNFTPDQLNLIQFLYLRGGFDYQKLKLIDKALVTLFKTILKHKKDVTSDEQAMLAVFAQPVDFTKEQNIAPLLLSIRI